MDDATIIDFTGRDAVTDPLTDLLRNGARELLQAAAVEAERDAFLAEFADRRTATSCIFKAAPIPAVQISGATSKRDLRYL